jgi:hypothetical protein
MISIEFDQPIVLADHEQLLQSLWHSTHIVPLMRFRDTNRDNDRMIGMQMGFMMNHITRDGQPFTYKHDLTSTLHTISLAGYLLPPLSTLPGPEVLERYDPRLYSQFENEVAGHHTDLSKVAVWPPASRDFQIGGDEFIMDTPPELEQVASICQPLVTLDMSHSLRLEWVSWFIFPPIQVGHVRFGGISFYVAKFKGDEYRWCPVDLVARARYVFHPHGYLEGRFCWDGRDAARYTPWPGAGVDRIGSELFNRVIILMGQLSQINLGDVLNRHELTNICPIHNGPVADDNVLCGCCSNVIECSQCSPGCDNCGEPALCASCAEQRCSPICHDCNGSETCENCSARVSEDEVYHCDRCDYSECSECIDMVHCEACGSHLCDYCRNTFSYTCDGCDTVTCSYCENGGGVFNRPGRNRFHCPICEQTYCPSCASTAHCDGCDRDVCDDCTDWWTNPASEGEDAWDDNEELVCADCHRDRTTPPEGQLPLPLEDGPDRVIDDGPVRYIHYDHYHGLDRLVPMERRQYVGWPRETSEPSPSEELHVELTRMQARRAIAEADRIVEAWERLRPVGVRRSIGGTWPVPAEAGTEEEE